MQYWQMCGKSSPWGARFSCREQRSMRCVCLHRRLSMPLLLLAEPPLSCLCQQILQRLRHCDAGGAGGSCSGSGWVDGTVEKVSLELFTGISSRRRGAWKAGCNSPAQCSPQRSVSRTLAQSSPQRSPQRSPQHKVGQMCRAAYPERQRVRQNGARGLSQDDYGFHEVMK